MLLEEYFDFLEPNVILMKGHQIAIAEVIDLYEQGYSAEQVVLHYPSLSLEAVYAVFTYYLHNKPKMAVYMERHSSMTGERMSRHTRREPNKVVKRIRALRETPAALRKMEAGFYTLP